MAVKINSFGGPVVWFFRKHCSGLTSRIMLKAVQASYSPDSQRYIDWFLEQDETPLPLNVMVETINRCNGKCAFCPANTKDEKREFKMMTDETYHEIISQLKELGWKGKLFMCVNNEPFMDKRIVDFARYAKEELSGIEIAMISNGTLLSEDKLDSLIGVVNQITINDYSEKYEFTELNKRLIDHIRKNEDAFKDIRITFNRRYSKEILATRAGNAPNKPKKNVKVTAPCLYPFTDLIIFPDGKAGMCCNDCFEVTDYGNVMSDSIGAIWGSSKFKGLRLSMKNGRTHPFCKECDVVDAGEREREISSILKQYSK